MPPHARTHDPLTPQKRTTAPATHTPAPDRTLPATNHGPVPIMPRLHGGLSANTSISPARAAAQTHITATPRMATSRGSGSTEQRLRGATLGKLHHALKQHALPQTDPERLPARREPHRVRLRRARSGKTLHLREMQPRPNTPNPGESGRLTRERGAHQAAPARGALSKRLQHRARRACGAAHRRAQHAKARSQPHA